ncbi:LPS-assembly protein LptD [Candidatus Aerophobetes bacterium]|nr:LPS-assembly protein LptD [Candidatus Aerophobetes bacterium]
MRKLLTLLRVFVIFLFILTPPGYTQQKIILLETDKLSSVTNPPLIMAEEGVKIYFGEILIKAEKIEINLDTTETKAEGEIHLSFNSYRIKGKRLEFNLEKKEGFIEEPQGSMEGHVLFQGKKAYFSSRKINLLEGNFTTCEHPLPHYQIKAEAVELYPGKKIVIKNAIFYLGSIPLFWSPVYVYYFVEKNRFLLPQPGYRQYSGWYIKTSYLFYPFENTEAVAHLDYYEKKGLAGGLDISHTSEKSKTNITAYYIKENDTGDVRGVGKIQGIGYLSTKSLLKLNVNYFTDADFLKDYFYHLPDEERQIFPSFFALDLKEKNASLLLQLQKKTGSSDDYPEFLPRIKLSLLSPTSVLRGLYIKQNTELTNFIKDDANTVRLWSSLDFSYPQTILKYIRFKPTLGWEFFWYKPEKKDATSGSINYQNYEFFSSLKGKRGDLTHDVFSTFGYYHREKSGPEFPELDRREKDVREENILRWKLQNEFFLRNSLLFSLGLGLSYDLSSAQRKLKPMEGFLFIPFARGSLYTDFSYDFYEQTFPFFHGGINLKQAKWELDASYSNYSGEGEYISAATSFEVVDNLSLSSKIGYNLKSERIENLSYGLDVTLHCLGLRFNIQEKPELDWNVSFYITAFPF